MTDERRERLQHIIDSLRGSCGTLEAECDEAGIDHDDLTQDELEFLDGQIFLCDLCNWWCGEDERSEDRDDVCDECA